MIPYYEEPGIQIFHGDCREILPQLSRVDVVIADPPYGVTSLDWDSAVDGWAYLVDAPCLWCFGSMRFFLSQKFESWKYAQEIIWEKHNGSIFHADRFRRVHEFAMQFYRGEWADLYKSPVYTMDATPRTVRRKQRPAHSGHIDGSSYQSEDGGPRLMRSVVYVPSCHGEAEHPTQKPVDIIKPLIEYSCPPDGVVLDPFMGSGTTLVAAQNLGRNCIGIEIEERYCAIAVERLRQRSMVFTYPLDGCKIAHTQEVLYAARPGVEDEVKCSNEMAETRPAFRRDQTKDIASQ